MPIDDTGCLFCGQVGDRSREHILRKDFKKFFPSKPGLRILQPHPDGSLRTEDRPIDQFDVMINAVCRSCNGGWLNDLENYVLPMILTAGRDGKDLHNADFERLGYWAVIRALLRTHMTPSGRAPVRFFREAYTTGRVPSGCFAHWAYSTNYVAPAGAHQSTSDVNDDYTALVSFGLGAMLFQVTIAAGSKPSRRLAIELLKRPQRWFPQSFYWIAPPEASHKTLLPLERTQAFAAINSFGIAIGAQVLQDSGEYLDPREVIDVEHHLGLVMPGLSHVRLISPTEQR